MEDMFKIQSPLYMRRVALLGNYSLQEEKAVRYELSMRGAVFTTKKDGKYQVSRTTHYCILFRDTSEEDLYKIRDFTYDGYYVKMIPYEHIDELYKEDLGTFYVEKDVVRNLKITSDFLEYERFKVDYKRQNPFSCKEIYIGEDLKGDRNIFFQIVGNLGGYANRELFPETNIILLSDTTVERIKNKEKDETIEFIQNSYNAGTDSLGTFTYKLVTESEYLTWVKKWCEKYHVEETMNMLKAYKQDYRTPM